MTLESLKLVLAWTPQVLLAAAIIAGIIYWFYMVPWLAGLIAFAIWLIWGMRWVENHKRKIRGF